MSPAPRLYSFRPKPFAEPRVGEREDVHCSRSPLLQSHEFLFVTALLRPTTSYESHPSIEGADDPAAALAPISGDLAGPCHAGGLVGAALLAATIVLIRSCLQYHCWSLKC